MKLSSSMAMMSYILSIYCFLFYVLWSFVYVNSLEYVSGGMNI